MYLGLKLLHVLAVVLFLGNITTGLFWKLHADRTRDPRLIAHAFEGIIRADRLFTLPGVAVIVATGLAAAVLGGYPLVRDGLDLWSESSSSRSRASCSRCAWRRCRSGSARSRRRGADGPAFDWAGYRALSVQWELWGAVALLTPLAALGLMVLKPDLYAAAAAPALSAARPRTRAAAPTR